MRIWLRESVDRVVVRRWLGYLLGVGHGGGIALFVIAKKRGTAFSDAPQVADRWWSLRGSNPCCRDENPES